MLGLGSSERPRLNNNITIPKDEFWTKFLVDCIDNFGPIAEYKGFDLQLSEMGFLFGIEPSYQYDDVLIIGIMFSDKKNCFIERGKAFGSYGSKQLTKIKVYADYKRQSKFTKFIDKWYEPLVEKLKEYKNEKTSYSIVRGGKPALSACRPAEKFRQHY